MSRKCVRWTRRVFMDDGVMQQEEEEDEEEERRTGGKPRPTPRVI